MNPTNAELPTAPDSQQMTEGNEYPYPRAASSFQRILAQGKYETLAMLKNGEQLMLNIAFPVLALFGLRYTSFLDSYADALNTTRINVAVPGVLALCVVSTALSGQGIATGFDRRFSVYHSSRTQWAYYWQGAGSYHRYRHTVYYGHYCWVRSWMASGYFCDVSLF